MVVTMKYIKKYKKQDKVQRLKRQLISDLLDDKIPTEESYEAIVKLWKMEIGSKNLGLASAPSAEWRKSIGISVGSLREAYDYVEKDEAKE